jgi:glycosyltransferase involved in cell wall biosynthesis
VDIVSWQPVLTDHQSYTLEALQRAAKGELTVYVGKTEHPAREAQGWVNPHAASLSPKVLPRLGWLRSVTGIIRAKPDAVHVFGSPFDHPRLIVALMIALTMRARVFLISEPYSPISAGYLEDRGRIANWLKARLRPVVYRIYGILIRRRIAGVFAISPLAVSQYRALGIPSEIIFPFGYFVPRASKAHPRRPGVVDEARGGLRVVFVGSLTTRKGIDVLIEAVKSLDREGVAISLDAYGPGDPGRFQFDEAGTRYRGTIPFGTAQAVIAEYDALVLPSRYDGWGVVVNEALMAGVPVVCSDCVGAGVVVEAWGCGAIFASEDVSDLKAKLLDLVLHRDRLAQMSAAVTEAGDSLDPDLAGRFMYESIRVGKVAKPRVPAFLSPTFRTEGSHSRA